MFAIYGFPGIQSFGKGRKICLPFSVVRANRFQGSHASNSSILYRMLQNCTQSQPQEFPWERTVVRFSKTIEALQTRGKLCLPFLVFQTNEFLGNDAQTRLCRCFGFCFEILSVRLYKSCYVKEIFAGSSKTIEQPKAQDRGFSSSVGGTHIFG